MSQSNGATTLTMQQAEVMPTVMPDGNGEAVSQVIFRYVPKSKVAQFTIRGKSPLLTNKIRERSVEEIRVKQDLGTRGKKGKRDKKSDFEQSMHIMPDGSTYGFPASGVKEAMVTAIRQVDFTSMAAGERLFYVLGEPRLIPLRCSRPVMRRSWSCRVAQPAPRPISVARRARPATTPEVVRHEAVGTALVDHVEPVVNADAARVGDVLHRAGDQVGNTRRRRSRQVSEKERRHVSGP